MIWFKSHQWQQESEHLAGGAKHDETRCLDDCQSFESSPVQRKALSEGKAIVSGKLTRVVLPKITLSVSRVRPSLRRVKGFEQLKPIPDFDCDHSECPSNKQLPADVRFTHVLKPCGHIIKTAKPSTCCQNCACKTKAGPKGETKISTQMHACDGCIERRVNSWHEDKRQSGWNAKSASEHHGVERMGTKSRFGNFAWLQRDIQQREKVSRAQKAYDMRKLLEDEIRTNGEICRDNDYVVGGSRKESFVTSRSYNRSSYRGVDQNDSLCHMRLK